MRIISSRYAPHMFAEKGALLLLLLPVPLRLEDERVEFKEAPSKEAGPLRLLHRRATLFGIK